MLKHHFVYMPVVPGKIEVEWEQCLNQIVRDRVSGNLPVKLNIFVNQPDYNSYVSIKKHIGKSIEDAFREQPPAFNITLHPPGDGWNVSVEGLFISSGSAVSSSKLYQSVPYIVLTSGSYKEIWAAGLGNDLYQNNTREAACAAFDSVAGILEAENMTFDNIVRQWNYIGDILKITEGFQNYQIFNEVRSEYYKRYRTVQQYPAATGVGMKFGGVFLDFCAVKADGNLRIRAVDNPNQVNAYEYSQQVLKGLTRKGENVKHPPQFERALLMINKTNKNMFISGTASIIGQETIGRGDIREQTLVTIENIKKLTESEHVSQLLGSSELISGRYTLLRVYVKNQADFPEVVKICSEHFPKVPALFIEADICRDDLLTEIEAEYLL